MATATQLLRCLQPSLDVEAEASVQPSHNPSGVHTCAQKRICCTDSCAEVGKLQGTQARASKIEAIHPPGRVGRGERPSTPSMRWRPSCPCVAPEAVENPPVGYTMKPRTLLIPVAAEQKARLSGHDHLKSWTASHTQGRNGWTPPAVRSPPAFRCGMRRPNRVLGTPRGSPSVSMSEPATQDSLVALQRARLGVARLRGLGVALRAPGVRRQMPRCWGRETGGCSCVGERRAQKQVPCSCCAVPAGARLLFCACCQLA